MKKRILLILLVMIIAIMSCFSLTGCTTNSVFSDIGVFFSYVFKGFDDIDTFCRRHKSYDTKQFTYIDGEDRLEIYSYRNLVKIYLRDENSEFVLYSEGIRSKDKKDKSYINYNLYTGIKSINDENYSWVRENISVDEYCIRTFSEFEDRTIPALFSDTILISWGKENSLGKHFKRVEKGLFEGIEEPYLGCQLRCELMTLSITTEDNVFTEYGVFDFEFDIPEDARN